MLYSKERHFPLANRSWNADQVLEFSHQTMAEVDLNYNEASRWPCHPLDRENSPEAVPGMYLGVDGIAWGLAHWNRLTGSRLNIQPHRILEKAIATNPYPHRSYFFGKTGTQLALQSFYPSEENLKSLHDSLEILEKSETNEIMAGAPGALIVWQFLWEMTGDNSLSEKIRRIAENILGLWTDVAGSSLPIWTQNYGNGPTNYLGAAHGAMGNIFVLLRVKNHLTDKQVEGIQEKAFRLLKASALQNESEANWPPRLIGPEQNLLVHWCHGSPGILVQLATLLPKDLDRDFDQLMIKAGNLVWNAGGLKKGASLCHGTTGSGAALLKLFMRTGDEIWLERARAMAMTAIQQIKEDKTKYGHLRYSLWTGDVGSALFLHACKDGRFETPMLDII